MVCNRTKQLISDIGRKIKEFTKNDGTGVAILSFYVIEVFSHEHKRYCYSANHDAGAQTRLLSNNN